MQQNVFQYLKNLYKASGIIGKIIAINLAVFLFFLILLIVEKGFLVEDLQAKVVMYFAGPGQPEGILYRPWTLITQLFTHADFLHFLFNMMVFFFTARMFVQFFGERKLLITYLIGGIFAYLTHVIIYYSVPAFQVVGSGPVIGASGSIMAIFIAVAFHKPNLKIYLYGLIKMPIIVLALLYIVLDISAIGAEDRIAHFAHLGGAVFGALSIINVNSSKSFMSRLDRFFSKFKWPKFSFKRKPKMKVYKNEAREMTDDEYNDSRKAHQKRVDAILDKISKKGYEGLTKEEKEILFNESKRN